MAIRRIFMEGEDVLRKKSRQVDTYDNRLHVLIDDMWDTLSRADGVGLASPQVGILKRVVVIDCGNNRMELVNPTIIESSGSQTGPEGCLSVEGRNAPVKRAMNVTFSAFDRYGNPYTKSVTGLEARCVQHELDHLEGILFIDRVKK